MKGFCLCIMPLLQFQHPLLSSSICLKKSLFLSLTSSVLIVLTDRAHSSSKFNFLNQKKGASVWRDRVLVWASCPSWKTPPCTLWQQRLRICRPREFELYQWPWDNITVCTKPCLSGSDLALHKARVSETGDSTSWSLFVMPALWLVSCQPLYPNTTDTNYIKKISDKKIIVFNLLASEILLIVVYFNSLIIIHMVSCEWTYTQ